MSEPVGIRLFGAFEIRVAGRIVTENDWPGRRSMELAQLLALAPNHSLQRDQVIEALWPRLAADGGAANLRKAAHHARRLLGADAVVLRSGRVSLFPAAEVETDVERFWAAAAAALNADGKACVAAARLVTGELLPGALYEDWSSEARRRVRATLLSLLRAGGEWSSVLEIDPTDELAAQELMRAALAADARSEAVRCFANITDALARDLGVRPSPVTVALYQQAIAGLEARHTELVGREMECATVDAAVGGWSARRPAAVVVRATAGMGKTAFCERLAARLRDQGRAVWWTDTGGDDRAFGPLISLVDEIALDPQEPLARIPEHARAVLTSLTPLAPSAPPVDGPLTRHQVMGAVTLALRAAAGDRPMAVILDDAHDADEGTLDLLLLAASSTPDLLVVLACRPEDMSEELRAGLARLERVGRVVGIELRPLERPDARRLARRVAPDGIDDETIDRVVGRSEGNPFAIIELASAAGHGSTDLPSSTAAAIIARLVKLDAGSIEALQHLALHPDDLDSASVIALTGVGERDAFSLLDRALDAGVLVVVNGRYRFRHDLVREALAARVPPHRRVETHRRAAQALAASGARPAVVAWHWLAGGKPEAAIDCSLAAAAEAMHVGAFRDARRYLAPVLAHDRSHPTALRLDAECLDMLGDPATLSAYDAAIASADPDVADDLVIARGLAQIKQGDPAGGLAAITGATPRSLMGQLNHALAYAGAAALGVTDPAIGTEKAAEVRRLALQTGDRAAIVIAAWAHAAAAHARGDLHDSVLSDLRETKDLPHLAVRVFDGHLCMTQRFLYGSRPYAEVLRFADELTAEARRLGALRGEAFGVTLRAEAMYLSGHLDQARRDFDSSLALHRQTGGTTGEAHALQRVAELMHSAGDDAGARAAIDQALALTRISDIGFHLLDRIYGSRITISTDPDDGLAAVEEAEAAVQGPLETCPGCRIHLAVPAAIAAAKAGDLQRAKAYESNVDFLANVVMRLPAWYAALDEVRAHVKLAEGDVDRASELFHLAARRYGQAGHPLDHQRCHDLAVSTP